MTEPWFFDVLPYRPTPYPDECLSGYLLRLAEANRFASFWEFVRDIFPHWHDPRQLTGLGWESPMKQWGRLLLRTQLPLADLKHLTVASLSEKLCPPLDLRWIGPGPGIFLRGAVNQNLRVCPQCLQAQPYLRLIWRFIPVQVCLQHGNLLQTHCRCCGNLLTPVGVWHRHLRCAVCNTDLRTLPVMAAPAEIMATQQRRQADLKFLLDPTVTLVTPSSPDSTGPAPDLLHAIGLKFRYLRLQTGQLVKDIAPCIGVSTATLIWFERGTYRSVSLCLSYLEALSLSWSDFAALQVPPEFARSLHELPYMHLRLCPTPECPNHQPPPSSRVSVQYDWPDRGIVRLRCTTCRRVFRRTYEGELVIRPRQPSPPLEKFSRFKPDADLARLKEMGLRGESDCEIAHQLGWHPGTVNKYWWVLGVKDQVQQAQAQRRAQEKQQRTAERCERLETRLQIMIDQDEEITFSSVARALGYNSGYFRTHPDLAKRVAEVAQQHNPLVKQRQYEAIRAQVTQALTEWNLNDKPITLGGITQQVGLPGCSLAEIYPELYAMIQQAKAEQQAKLKAACTQARCVRINEAIARLMAQGFPLTMAAIARESGVTHHQIEHDPVLDDLLHQWLDDMARRD